MIIYLQVQNKPRDSWLITSKPALHPKQIRPWLLTVWSQNIMLIDCQTLIKCECWCTMHCLLLVNSLVKMINVKLCIDPRSEKNMCHLMPKKGAYFKGRWLMHYGNVGRKRFWKLIDYDGNINGWSREIN